MYDIFHLHNELGIPLEIILEGFNKVGWTISWGLFYERALAYGWNPRSTVSKLEAAIEDTMDDEYLQGWRISMKRYLSIREKKNKPL